MPDPARGALSLPDAMRSGAVVLLRTWVDDLPEEAKAITTLFLADAAASALALPEGTEWAALIDEFGGVLSAGAGERALALMQRARSAGGQVAVSTQSVLDFAAATGNTALLDALADNFSAGVFHRQSSPESRDWLARLIGTREVWQSTDRTGGGGSFAEGSGSRRRVREFLIRPDEFRALGTGEAVVWTTLGPAPERITVAPAALPAELPAPVGTEQLYRPCGPSALPDPDQPEALDLASTHTRAWPEVPTITLAPLVGEGEIGALRAYEAGSDHHLDADAGYLLQRAVLDAVARRARGATHRVHRVGAIEIDTATREVRVAGELVELSGMEYALLSALAADPRRVFTKAELLRDVWGFRSDGRTRTLDSHACRLRRKLSERGAQAIVNVWGVGYRLTDAEQAQR
jgi:DNA-binding winged helix-turn-helix (wHTH) protein